MSAALSHEWVLGGLLLTAACFVAATLLRAILRCHSSVSFRGKHCIVTGGSSGIGLEVARRLAEEGARVTLIARNRERLREAADRIRAAQPDATVEIVHGNLSLQYSSAEAALRTAEEKLGPCYALFHMVGVAVPLPLRELSPEQIDLMTRTNLLSAMYCSKVVVPGMIARKEGRILLTSSGAGLVGTYGYTAYGATKFGVRGFGEALQMELKTHGIAVSIAFPPDTETPGFEAENKLKNTVIHKISADGGLFQPEEVAKDIVEGSKRGSFLITTGLDLKLLALLNAGFSPANSVTELFTSAVAKPVLRIVSAFYHFKWHGYVHDYEQQSQKEGKTKKQ